MLYATQGVTYTSRIFFLNYKYLVTQSLSYDSRSLNVATNLCIHVHLQPSTGAELENK